MAKIVEAGNRCFVAFIDVAKALYSVWEDSLCCQHFEPSVRGKTWHVLYWFYLYFRCFATVQSHLLEWDPLREIHVSKLSMLFLLIHL